MAETRIIRIKRQESPNAEPYYERFTYTEAPNMCILDALEQINGAQPLINADGKPTSPVVFSHACKVGKCGLCSMVINGEPRLACGTYVQDYDGEITVEPLSKFPTVHDLVTDKSAIDDMLKAMEVWPHGKLEHDQKNYDLRFASAQCMQCGCCLEACPNFEVGGTFYGNTTMVNTFRVLDELNGDERKEYKTACKEHLTNPCSHALTCNSVCPQGLPIVSLLARLNGR